MQINGAFELSSVDGSNGFVALGGEAGAYAGFSVRHAGDFNGDGFDDVIIGAPNAAPTGQPFAGAGYVMLGTASPPTSPIELATLDPSTGLTLAGPGAGASAGYAVSAAGDVNGDGFDDVIVGAPRTSGYGVSYGGASYVVFGAAAGLGPVVGLQGLDGSNGFVIPGIVEYGLSGFSVAAAGDFNGDGIDDVIVGAPDVSRNGRSYAGEAQVVFGAATPFATVVDPTSFDGTNGVTLVGANPYGALLGIGVAGAGDINGDGIDDIVIGTSSAPGGEFYAGESYVVFGTRAPLPATLDLADLDGDNGFVIKGAAAFDALGAAVAGAGDINGDGIDDLLVGAKYASPGGAYEAGEAYVVFGSSDGFPQAVDVGGLDGGNGFRVSGIAPGDEAGGAVSGIGDFNGDGIDDLLIGAAGADTESGIDAGSGFVLFGSVSGFSAALAVSALDGFIGVALDGAAQADGAGRSVSGAGDFNGDGIDDLIIGAPYADADGAGETGASVILFGSRDFGGEKIVGTPDDDLIEGTPGADRIHGLGGFDWIWGRLGNDVIDGGPGHDVLRGDGGNDTITGDSGDDNLYGGDNADALSGGPGNDRLDGDAGPDTLDGQSGNDTVNGGAGDELANGGNGADRLIGGDGDDRLVGNLGDDRLQGNAGEDSLFGGLDDDMLSGGLGNDSLWGDAGSDTVSGGAGADVIHLRADGAADVADGDGGADLFKMAPRANGADAARAAVDTIADFEVGRDRIDITAFDLETKFDVGERLRQEGSDVVLRLHDLGGDDVLLRNVALLDLGVADFLI